MKPHTYQSLIIGLRPISSKATGVEAHVMAPERLLQSSKDVSPVMLNEV